MLSLASLVRGLAASAAAETRAERETGQGNDQWWGTLAEQMQELLTSGRYPQLATMPGEAVRDLDGVLEHALARHLDGLAAHLARPRRTAPSSGVTGYGRGSGRAADPS